MKTIWIQLLVLVLVPLSLSACSQATANGKPPPTKVTVATVQARPVTLNQAFVGQVKPHRQVQIRPSETGYVKAVLVNAGQTVKKGDVLFQVTSKAAIANGDDGVVSLQAPFDGVVSRALAETGSLVKKGETMATVSDNSVVGVYFNVPEALYLELMSIKEEERNELKFEFVTAGGKKFNRAGKLGLIGADFNEQTGAVPFRADFPNPDGTLFPNQTGTLILGRERQEAVVVPQRATFEIGQQRFVYVVDAENVVHQREIVVRQELEDLFVIETGIAAGDKFVLEGGRLIQDGDKVQFEER